MQETKQALVENGLKKLLADVDRSFLRKMEGDMYLCSAKCCENKEMSYEEVRSCVDKCSISVLGAQNVVKSELEYFQTILLGAFHIPPKSSVETYEQVCESVAEVLISQSKAANYVAICGDFNLPGVSWDNDLLNVDKEYVRPASQLTRLQRCVQQCHDDIQHKMPLQPKPDEMDQATKMFDACAAKCCDDHVRLLPGLFQKISQKAQGKIT